MAQAAPRLPLFHGLLLLSGFAGLGYQMVWTRMLAVGLGHEIVSVLAVIAAFFSGLALGAWVLDARISRSRHPGRWYAALEAVIGGWALALIALIPAANDLAATLIGIEPSPLRHWGVAFLLPFLLLLPATAAMGATLPAMERLVSRRFGEGRAVGGLYAANTFGAVAGTLVTTFWIAPGFGFTITLIGLAAVNALCAVAGLWLARPGPLPVAAPAPAAPPPLADLDPGRTAATGRLLITLFATGLLGIGYEVLIVRMLSQILENTVYTFAAVLAVYLLGTAIGGALYPRFRRSRDTDAVLTSLLIALSLSCLGGVALLWVAKPAYEALRVATAGPVAGITAEIAVAAMVFLLPTMVMGATFTHLAQRLRDSRDRLGHALAVNTLGGAVAPLLFGIALLPALGSRAALALVCAGYLLLMLWLRPGRLRLGAAAVPAAAAVALAVAPVDLRFVTVPPGGSVLSHAEGVMAAVTVVSDGDGHRYLKVNDEFQMGSTASTYSDRRQAQVPLLLHPDPRQALFLGLGTGATFAGALDHPRLQADGVELVPEIIATLPAFATVLDGLLDSERVRIVAADARRFVRATDRRYDVIIADVYHPSRDGAGSLYTAEHFQAIRDRLAPGGLFCQWLPLYQLTGESLRTIVRTFLTVFPDATAHLAHLSLVTPMLCLLGRTEPQTYPTGWVAARLADPSAQAAAAAIDLAAPLALFGTFVGTSADLARFAGDGPINTDDRPVITFQAPEAVYGPGEPAWARLPELLNVATPVPGALVDVAGDDDFADRLAAYWQARDRFLAAGSAVRPSADVREMARQVAGPLLAIVRDSADFEPAYRPLLSLARQLAAVDPDAAARLLAALGEANPARDDAERLYVQLFSRGGAGGGGTANPPKAVP